MFAIEILRLLLTNTKEGATGKGGSTMTAKSAESVGSQFVHIYGKFSAPRARINQAAVFRTLRRTLALT